jgi:Fuc2NAc and GlcNAc transferase
VTNSAMLVVGISLTVFLAWLATGYVRRHALRNAMLDIPNTRSSHVTPTPRGGGLAIVGVFTACICLFASRGMLDVNIAIAFVGGGIAVALIGYLDDRTAVPAGIRFSVHLAAATLTVFMVGGVTDHSLRVLGLHGAVVGGVVGVLVLSWATNLFNFMDGIDGIAASEAIFIAVAGAGLNWLHGGDAALSVSMLALAATTLGFLIWNWPPARIFMGDVGSGFLGFSLGSFGLAVSQREVVSIEVWAILAGVFLVDATLTLARRLARGERWYEAHRLHAYQRLASRWKAHLPVTVLVILVNILWLLPWAYVAAESPAYALWCVAAALIPIGIVVLFLGAGGRDS